MSHDHGGSAGGDGVGAESGGSSGDGGNGGGGDGVGGGGVGDGDGASSSSSSGHASQVDAHFFIAFLVPHLSFFSCFLQNILFLWSVHALAGGGGDASVHTKQVALHAFFTDLVEHSPALSCFLQNLEPDLSSHRSHRSHDFWHCLASFFLVQPPLATFLHAFLDDLSSQDEPS